MLDEILTRIQNLDAAEIIQRFDADFDIPGRAAEAVGLLRLAGAFSPVQTRQWPGGTYRRALV